MRRPQFTIRALLVAMLVVAAFLGGMAVQRWRDTPVLVEYDGPTWHGSLVPRDPPAMMSLPDGSHWLLLTEEESESN